MPRKKSSVPTEMELELLGIVWEKGEATVQEVKDSLPAKRPLAYTSVLSMMRVLEQKGYLTHSLDGRTYVYRPLLTREEATRKMTRRLLDLLFDGSPSRLVVSLLEDESIDSKEVDRLRKAIADYGKKRSSK